MEITVGFLLLAVLLIVGLPVSVALALAGGVGLYLVGGLQLATGILATTPLGAVHSYEFVMIPMFILMANFIVASGISEEMFDIAKKWMGRTPGGLAHATALTGAAFGAISGSSTAAAATLASTTIPGMVKQGYDTRLASGVVAISGTLAMLIPPSGAMIIYALLADMSVAKLLIAGVVPGILVTLAIMLTILFLVWRNPEHAPAAQSYGWWEKIASLRHAWSFILLFSMVTVVIYTGVGTPTEASAMGALGAFLLALLRGTSFRQFVQAGVSTLEASCMIAMIFLGAQVFVYFLTMTQATQSLVGWLVDSQIPSLAILIAILAIYLILGCFMDLIAMLILTVPIVTPLMLQLGYDPIWFAVITIVMGEIGVLTPPLGINVFVISKYTRLPVGEVFRGAFPHVIAHLILVALLVAFPELVLWLPSTMN
ncbi:TRAP transporter large permease [Celeribacter indicus]|uniref:TRAP transporter large permease protein n=1 Tax=Celeribacter indicus TaxID=1208324 RepID=A0A0B5E7U0_9RHOB|nr:TRAP transporter large permease [Celeribacter indicus]AJE49116.1 transmembrane protein [Celeribacter indicus]SDX48484.1 TRAP transporter, DctM subunit [Celeribacter indicus]